MPKVTVNCIGQGQVNTKQQKTSNNLDSGDRSGGETNHEVRKISPMM